MWSLLVMMALAQEPVRASLPAPGSVTLETDEVVVPMRHETGHVIVPVTIDGRGPYPFALDTAAMGHGRIDSELAKQLGLRVAGSVDVADGTLRNSRPADLCQVATLDLGGASFGGIQLVATPARSADWRGVLGFGLFRDLLLTIDYPRSKIVISEGSLERDGDHVVALVGDPGIARIDLSVGDTRMEARVDTGNAGSFTVEPSVLAHLKTTGEPRAIGRGRSLNNEFEIRAVKLAEPLRLAGHAIEGLDVHVVDIFRGANLGHAVLKRFALTFDQADRLVRFAMP